MSNHILPRPFHFIAVIRLLGAATAEMLTALFIKLKTYKLHIPPLILHVCSSRFHKFKGSPPRLKIHHLDPGMDSSIRTV
jgi:hypothetical protein